MNEPRLGQESAARRDKALAAFGNPPPEQEEEGVGEKEGKLPRPIWFCDFCAARLLCVCVLPLQCFSCFFACHVHRCFFTLLAAASLCFGCVCVALLLAPLHPMDSIGALFYCFVIGLYPYSLFDLSCFQIPSLSLLNTCTTLLLFGWLGWVVLLPFSRDRHTPVCAGGYYFY